MLNVGIYLYDEAEVLDFSGPFEVFATASRLWGADGCFHTFLVGETGGPVVARGGYRVQPNYGLRDHPPLDVLIVAGGAHRGEMEKPAVLGWIARQAAEARIVASVCTGAFLLARAGVLERQRVTTHWEDIADLKRTFPGLTVLDGVRWVDEGHVVTSAGISAGIDMSLHLVGRLAGEGLAARTARQMAFSRTEEAGGAPG